ncbi:MAG: adenylate/guanylate cyclase domain-containing protein [Leptospiraceae bacterium]|nr:adenylate/guanylate cyclase domain-containing protein [Leptospiraceae bacterium]MDW8307427.1 adenylate/guanylate cyclase domain-containing protein [Leptospiraceae bacterium]
MAKLGFPRALLFVFFLVAKPLWAQVREGVLDVSQSPGQIIKLQGHWQVFPSVFLDPADTGQKGEIIEVPKSWWQARPDLFPAGVGFATLRIKLLFAPSELGQVYALKLGRLSSAYRLYLNNTLLLEVGRPGKNENEEEPAWQSQLKAFVVSQEENFLTLHISNFSDDRFGGILEPILLGPHEELSRTLRRRLVYEAALSAILISLGFFHLLYFTLRRSERYLLAFGLFALVIGMRTTFFGLQVLQELWQFPFGFLLYLDYVTIYLSPALLSFYMHALFPKEITKLTLSVVFAVTAMLLSTLFILPVTKLSWARAVFHLFVLVLIAYYIVLLVQAMRRKRPMARVFVAGFIMLSAFAIHDIYENRKGTHNYQLPLGLVIFQFIQTYIMGKMNSLKYVETVKVNETLRQVNQAIHRFVPYDAIKLLNKREITEVERGTQLNMKLSIMFADMRNFSSISEKLSPEENFNFLNSYLSLMGPIIRKNQGFIDKFLGDGFMALFPTSPQLAFKAAIQLQEELRNYNEAKIKENYPPVEFGVGIHYGEVMLGVLGEAERVDVTVISDAVNLAARLQELSRILETPVVMSEVFFQQLTDVSDINYRMLGQVRVKGKTYSVTVFEALSARSPEVADALALSKGIFERGIFHYLEKDYARAEELFAKSLIVYAEDKVAKMYLERCRQLRENPKSEWELGMLLV